MKGKKMTGEFVRAAHEVCDDEGGLDALDRAQQILARLQRLNLRLSRVDNELGHLPGGEDRERADRSRNLLNLLTCSQRELALLEATVSSIERKLGGGGDTGADGDCAADYPEDD